MADRSLSDIANSITLSMGTENSVGSIASIVDDISSTLYEQLNFLEMMSDSLDDLLQSRIGEGASVTSDDDEVMKALVDAALNQLKSLSDISGALDNTLAFQEEQAQDQARKDKLGMPERDSAPIPEDSSTTRSRGSRERDTSDSSVFGDVLGGTLFGSILASLTSKLSLLGKSLLPGINGLKGLLKTGGITLVLWGLYEIFKDIGENENFQNLLVKIKEIWETKVIPAFNSIVESLTDIGNTIASAFGGETANNIRILVQDVFIAAFEDLALIIGSLAKSLSGVLDVVAGIVDIIAGVLTLDWEKRSEGFSRVTRGILKFFDGIIESLLTLVTIDVEIDLFSAAQNAWRATIEWITEKVNTVVESIRAIPDIISAAMDYFREGAESVGNWFSTLPTRLMLSAQELWANTQAAFMRRIAELVDWFTSLPDRIMLAVNKFVLDRGGIAASIFGVTSESVAEQEAALESRRGMSAEALDQIEQTRLESLRAIEEQRRQLDQVSDPTNRAGGERTQVVVPPANNTTDARRITNTNNTFITTTNPLAGVDRAMPQ